MSVKIGQIPETGLLKPYSVRPGCHTGCFFVDVPGRVELSHYVSVFFTTPVFKLERKVLSVLAASPSDHQDVVDLASGAGDRLSMWRVEARHVTQTAPHGHAGAFATLDAAVRHHLDLVASLYAYDRSQAILPDLPGATNWRVLDDPNEMASIAAANELAPMALSETEVADILAFLASLTDAGTVTGRLGIPLSVPSGLPVQR